MQYSFFAKRLPSPPLFVTAVFFAHENPGIRLFTEPPSFLVICFYLRKFDLVPDPQPVGAAKLLPTVDESARVEVVSRCRHIHRVPELARQVDQFYREACFE